MAALPSDLRAVMKPITKYTDNVAGGTNNASNISATIDYLPLLAEFEIFGKRTYANSYEKNYQAQYAYYANGNSKVKYKNSDATAAAAWWSRSPYYTDTTMGVMLLRAGLRALTVLPFPAPWRRLSQSNPTIDKIAPTPVGA